MRLKEAMGVGPCRDLAGVLTRRGRDPMSMHLQRKSHTSTRGKVAVCTPRRRASWGAHSAAPDSQPPGQRETLWGFVMTGLADKHTVLTSDC